jgi:hypothetical protein
MQAARISACFSVSSFPSSIISAQFLPLFPPQPPFNPLRAYPKAASWPSRQKQIPAMRLVKSGCDFFRVWFRLDRFGGSSLMGVPAVFNEGPSSHWECRRASDQHSLLSARLLVRKAPGDLFESRKENAVSSSNRTSSFRDAHGISQTRDIRGKIEAMKFCSLVRWFRFGLVSSAEVHAASGR